jgi:hypothetical protein
MAQELGYGQPMGGIAQTAFLVEDLLAAIAHWVTNCHAGPFFVLPHFLVPGQRYRGEESRADITIAMGFAGHMLMELIQPLDDHPASTRRRSVTAATVSTTSASPAPTFMPRARSTSAAAMSRRSGPRCRPGAR